MHGLMCQPAILHRGSPHPMMILTHRETHQINEITDRVMRQGGRIASDRQLGIIPLGISSEATIGPDRMLLSLGDWHYVTRNVIARRWRERCSISGRLLLMPFLGAPEQVIELILNGFINQFVIALPVRFTRDNPEIP